MSENATKLNGTAQRKTLASQLDRLDGILDALDVALAEAVRDAVAGAIREAVQAVTRELFANPEVLRALAGAAAQAVPTAPPAAPPVAVTQVTSSRVRERAGRAWDATVAALAFVVGWVWSGIPKAKGWLVQACGVVWRNRVVAGSSLAVGLLVGAASYLSGPTVSAAGMAVCSTAMSAAAFIILPFTNLWSRLTRRPT